MFDYTASESGERDGQTVHKINLFWVLVRDSQVSAPTPERMQTQYV